MTRIIRHTAIYSASLAVLLLLSACGKSEQPAPAPAAAPATGSTTAMADAATAASTPAAAAPAPAASSATTPATASSAAAAPAPEPAAAAPLSVTKVTLGSEVNADHQVTKAESSFAANDKTLYASVATEGSSGGATLNAKWSYLVGSSQLVSSISQSIATDGPAVTTFKVQNPDLWPEGKYQVEISLDGKQVAKQNFEITKS